MKIITKTEDSQEQVEAALENSSFLPHQDEEAQMLSKTKKILPVEKESTETVIETTPRNSRNDIDRKAATIFFIFGILCLIPILTSPNEKLLWGIMLWPSLNFIFLSIPYAFNGSYGVRMLGKNRTTGKINPINFFIFLPYYLLMYLTWWIKHLIMRERPYEKVADSPDIYVGRYPLWYHTNFPDVAEVVVDLTAEFPSKTIVCENRDYHCIPCLDRLMPPREELANVAKKTMQKKNVFVHCANGHGRSACFAALLMVLNNQSSTIQDAMKEMKKRRSVIKAQLSQQTMVKDALEIIRNEIGSIQ